MFEKYKREYAVRTTLTDMSEDLELLLNEMSEEGWELFMMHETESDDGDFQYNCIFQRDIQEIQVQTDEAVDVNTFKTKIEKMFGPSEEPYEQFKDIQRQISSKQTEIEKTKSLLESSESDTDHSRLNDDISEKIAELDDLNLKLAEVLYPDIMFERIGQDKITIFLSDELLELVDSTKNAPLMAETLKLRQSLADDLGYVLPAIKFKSSDLIEPNEYKIDIRGLKALSGYAYLRARMFFLGQSNIDNVPEDAIEDVDSVSETEIFWLEEEKTVNFWEKGLTPEQVIVKNLQYIVCRHVDEILDYKDITRYTDFISNKNSYLVDNLVPDPMSIGDIRYIFAGLLREKVSVKDIVYIFERLNDLSQYTNDKDLIIEKLRLSLSRQICNNVADENGNIYGIVINDELSDKLKDFLDEESENLFFATDEPLISKLVVTVSEIVKNSPQNIENIAVICNPSIRTQLYYLLEQVTPGISVISKFELVGEINLEVIANLSTL